MPGIAWFHFFAWRPNIRGGRIGSARWRISSACSCCRYCDPMPTTLPLLWFNPTYILHSTCLKKYLCWFGQKCRWSQVKIRFCVFTIVIACNSKKQPIVALSSTDVEYRGAAAATCDAIWLKRLLKDLLVEVFEPTVIYCNNINKI